MRDAKVISLITMAHFVSHLHALLLPPVFVLPSTSGLACRSWDPAPWHALAARLRQEAAA